MLRFFLDRSADAAGEPGGLLKRIKNRLRAMGHAGAG
jgi:hypothetical protein